MLAMALAQNDQPNIVARPTPKPVSLQQAAIIAASTAVGSVILNAIVLWIVWKGEDMETPHAEIEKRLKDKANGNKAKVAAKTNEIKALQAKNKALKEDPNNGEDGIELQIMQNEDKIRKLEKEKGKLEDLDKTLSGSNSNGWNSSNYWSSSNSWNSSNYWSRGNGWNSSNGWNRGNGWNNNNGWNNSNY
ncbi:hypothetical protein H4R18_005479 [Coemansia javaensis]|uniref:Uncharacterized protein n=1 Tax=Coemansia javaensis TaxID=2761396 RepID=A0A9W8H315_9FUNG|nr:hypothetical protein H4R18_005479 [Coemansia javaensis]